MRTIVFQSFRTTRVPTWMEYCMASVQTWAEQNRFSYRRLGDEFLDLAPDWYRRSAGPFVCVVTDLTRLVYARLCLMDGFDRAIWLDADVLIFAPAEFQISEEANHAYYRKVWLSRDASGNLIPTITVNNGICAFTQAGMDHLQEYIAHCQEIVRSLGVLRDNVDVGARFLTDPARAASLSVMKTVGAISPPVMQAILESDQAVLSQYRFLQEDSIHAADLCNSFRNAIASPDAAGLYDYLCYTVIRKLLDTRGAALNGASPDADTRRDTPRHQ
jgi:hypothetical protein